MHLLDLTALGASVAVAGGALLLVFGYLHAHADKFREDNHSRLAALRARLGNDLFLEILTKLLPQLDTTLKKSPPFLPSRQKLLTAMMRNDSLEPALHELRETAERSPPSVSESRQFRDLTEELLKRFQRHEEIAKACNDGYALEQRAANRVLVVSIALIAMGLLVIGASEIYTGNPADTSWLPTAEVIGFFLGIAVFLPGVDAVGSYQRGLAAQTRFLQAVDTELYESSPTAGP